MKTISNGMSLQQQVEHLKMLRKKKEEVERRLDRVSTEIKLWEAIRKGSSAAKIQALIDHYFRRP